MIDQNRRRNDQYAVTRRSESDVTLDPVAAYNADGSFEFPPFPQSFDQVRAFWADAYVSDEVLRKMQRAYVEQQHNARSEVLQQWKSSHPMPNHYKLGGRPNPAYEEWMNELVRLDIELQEKQPADILPALARHLARAAGMFEQAADLHAEAEPGALERFWAHEVTIGTRTTRMADLLGMYPVHTLDRETWIDRTAEANVTAAQYLEELASSSE